MMTVRFLTLLKELTRSSQTLQRAVQVVISSLQMGRLGEVKEGADDQGCCKCLRFVVAWGTTSQGNTGENGCVN